MTTLNGTNIGSINLTTVIKQTSQLLTSTASWNVGSSSVSYMRAKSVTFTAQGLKPNTRYYPFFGGVYVGEYCTTVDSPVLVNGKIAIADQPIITNALGSVTGNFYLPANTFVSGSHEFQLVDNYNVVAGKYVADPIYGSAQATYVASATLKQQETQVNTNTTIPSNVTSPVAPSPSTTSSGVTAPPVEQCESWYFEYTVQSPTTKTFTVTSSSATPPVSPSPSIGGAIIEPGSMTYVSTTPIGGGSYQHRFTYRVAASSNRGVTYRQEWIGKTTETRPDLASFRPSGLTSSDVVTIKKPWTFIKTAACPINLGLKTPKRVDPLAQSFFVDAAQFPNGMCVTSIALYFRSVDQSTPVILELRDMVNGLPGPNVLPGGSVVLPGYATGQSGDASLATVFRFTNPIYLQPSTDYCFVVKSTSLGYNAWCSRLGETDIATGKRIESQPFSGTLFKSENDVTWIPDSLEDLKFDLNIANFNTNVDSTLVFRPQKNTATNNYYSTAQNLPLSFISTTKGSSVVGLNLPMHSLMSNDKIYITGISSDTTYHNLPASALIGEHIVTVVDEDNVTFTVTGATANKTGNLVIQDLYGVIDNIPSIMPDQTTLLAAPVFVNSNNLSPSTVQTDTLVINQPTQPEVTSAYVFTVYTNIQANEVMIDYLGTEFDLTSVTEEISLATGQSTAGAEVPYNYTDFIEIEKDGRFHEFDEPRMIATPRNETLHQDELTFQPSVAVKLKLASEHKDLSPIIDTNGMSIMVRSYKIDNQNGEIDTLITAVAPAEDFNDPTQNSEINSGTGIASAKYKTTINKLTSFYNELSIFVTANCPDPARIDCYIRTSTDESTHQDRPWTWVPIEGVHGTVFTPSPDKYITNEWLFIHNTDTPFNVFDIKLVMRSTNNSVVPKIFSIRSIANNV